MRMILTVFRDASVVKCFWAFILSVMEYCSAVWISVATIHLLLLDCVVGIVSPLSGRSVCCDLWHRLKVATLCVFFQIDSLVCHPASNCFSTQYVMRRSIRGALAVHSRYFEMPKYKNVKFFALLSCLVFDCGMGCMILPLLAKVCVLLKLQSIAFFYKIDSLLFLPALRLLLFHLSFSQDLR